MPIESKFLVCVRAYAKKVPNLHEIKNEDLKSKLNLYSILVSIAHKSNITKSVMLRQRKNLNVNDLRNLVLL